MSTDIRNSTTSDASIPLMHSSFVKFGESVELKRCIEFSCSCKGLYHCPFCDAKHFKPCKPCRVQEHLEESHWPAAVQYKDVLIVRCFHDCQSESGGHYHCPVCPQIFQHRSVFLPHLYQHLEEQEESAELAYAAESKQPSSLLCDDYVIDLCKKGCLEGAYLNTHYHCPGCDSVLATIAYVSSHLRKCLKILQHKPPLRVQQRKPLENPRTLLPKWHKSVIRNMADIPIRRCASRKCCDRRYHCPLCSYKKRKPDILVDLRHHFCYHLDHSIKHEGYMYLACLLDCDKSYPVSQEHHFHCAFCGMLHYNSISFKTHLEKCQLVNSAIRCSLQTDSGVASAAEIVENSSPQGNNFEKGNKGSRLKPTETQTQTDMDDTLDEITNSVDFDVATNGVVFATIAKSGKSVGSENSVRPEKKSVRPETIDCLPPFEMFESVSATLSQHVLKAFDFMPKDSAETLFREAAVASSVKFSCAPGTDPRSPVFNLQGSLEGIARAESLLHERLRKVNDGAKFKIPLLKDPKFFGAEKNQIKRKTEDTINSSMLKGKEKLPGFKDSTSALSMEKRSSKMPGRIKKVKEKVSLESDTDSDQSDFDEVETMDTDVEDPPWIPDGSRSLANKCHKEVTSSPSKPYFTRGKKVDTSMLQSSKKTKLVNKQLDVKDSSPKKRKVAKKLQTISTDVTSTIPEKGKVFLLNKLPDNITKAMGTTSKILTHGKQKVIVYNKMPDHLKQVLKPLKLTGEGVQKPIPYSHLPENIKKLLPPKTGQKISVSASKSFSSTVSKVNNSVKPPSIKLNDFLKKKCCYMPTVQVKQDMELIVEKRAMAKKATTMANIFQEKMNTLFDSPNPKLDNMVSESPNVQSCALLTELETWESEQNKEMKALLEEDCNSTDKTTGKPCPICQEIFFAPGHLSVHMMSSHNKYKCPQCLVLFTNKNSLSKHFSSVHSAGSHLSLKNALEQNLNNELCRCGECDQIFVSRKLLNRHQSSDHLYKIQCTVCKRNFKAISYLYDHVKWCHTTQTNSMMCDICGKTFSKARYVLAHKRRHLSERNYPCQVCGKTFKDRNGVKEHEEIHKPTEERHFRYVCSYCGKRFTNKRSFSDHTNAHIGIKPYECKICGKSFAYTNALIKHQQVKHCEVRPYQCELCPKSFKLKEALKSHIVTHTGLSEHKCAFCQRAFGNRGILKAHLPKCKVYKEAHENEGQQTAQVYEDLQIVSDVSSSAGETQELATDTVLETVQFVMDISQKEGDVPLSTEEADSVMQESFLYMCSACQSAFSDLSTAELHINQCQGDTA